IFVVVPAEQDNSVVAMGSSGISAFWNPCAPILSVAGAALHRMGWRVARPVWRESMQSCVIPARWSGEVVVLMWPCRVVMCFALTHPGAEVLVTKILCKF